MLSVPWKRIETVGSSSNKRSERMGRDGGWNREAAQCGRDGVRVSRENVPPAGPSLLKQRRISRMVGGKYIGSACD